MRRIEYPVLTDILGGDATASDDGIRVRHAHAPEPTDLAELIHSDWPAFRRTRTVLVETGAADESDPDIEALNRLVAHGVRVIGAGPRPLRSPAPLAFLYERDFPRAAVASIYALSAGQTIILITRTDDSIRRLHPLLAHAFSWRRAWRE
ncbi:MAG: hypothetical protein NZ561_09340, partial [Phycisphaerae bacterium]|nr:hypothetical protein [Phycisphaerae bacterium]